MYTLQQSKIPDVFLQIRMKLKTILHARSNFNHIFYSFVVEIYNTIEKKNNFKNNGYDRV